MLKSSSRALRQSSSCRIALGKQSETSTSHKFLDQVYLRLIAGQAAQSSPKMSATRAATNLDIFLNPERWLQDLVIDMSVTRWVSQFVQNGVVRTSKTSDTSLPSRTAIYIRLKDCSHYAAEQERSEVTKLISAIVSRPYQLLLKT